MPQFVHYALLNAHTMGADVSSAAQDIRDYVYYSIQFTWTGSPTGNVSVQGSIDQTNWVDLATATACGGTAGSLLIDPKTPTGLPYIRAHYAYTSGTGALTATVFTKSGA